MKSFNLFMFTSPMAMWDAWFVVIACAFTAVSAIMALNHQPRVGNWPEKAMLYMVAFGAGGVAMGPFFGEGLFPNVWDLTMYSGVAVFSVWLTAPYWRQLPMLDRRKHRVPPLVTACDTASERRGPDDQDDNALCSH